jgi:hypothetical protein
MDGYDVLLFPQIHRGGLIDERIIIMIHTYHHHHLHHHHCFTLISSIDLSVILIINFIIIIVLLVLALSIYLSSASPIVFCGERGIYPELTSTYSYLYCIDFHHCHHHHHRYDYLSASLSSSIHPSLITIIRITFLLKLSWSQTLYCLLLLNSLILYVLYVGSFYYPRGTYSDLLPDTTSLHTSTGKFLNSGCIMGRVTALREMFEYRYE